MRLRDVIGNLGGLPEESTIYVQEPWSYESNAIVECEPDEGGLPEKAKAAGLVYFIEVAIAREFLDGWVGNLANPPTVDEKCARLIQYAVNDA